MREYWDYKGEEFEVEKILTKDFFDNENEIFINWHQQLLEKSIERKDNCAIDKLI